MDRPSTKNDHYLVVVLCCVAVGAVPIELNCPLCPRHCVIMSEYGWWKHRARVKRVNRLHSPTIFHPSFIALYACHACPQQICVPSGSPLFSKVKKHLSHNLSWVRKLGSRERESVRSSIITQLPLHLLCYLAHQGTGALLRSLCLISQIMMVMVKCFTLNPGHIHIPDITLAQHDPIARVQFSLWDSLLERWSQKW